MDVLFLVGGLLAGGGEFRRHFGIDGSEVFLLGLQRRVGDLEGNVAEEGLVFALADELDGVLSEQIVGVALILRAELQVVPPGDGTLTLDRAPIEVVGTATVVDPGFVKTVRVDTVAAVERFVRHVTESFDEMGAEGRCVRVVAIVPLAENTRAIAIRLEAFGDGRLLLLKLAAGFRSGTDTDRMPPRQQHGSCRRANAPAHELSQLDALGEELVDVRRRDAAAVLAEVAPADIVSHDVNDVGFGWCGADVLQRHQNAGAQQGQNCDPA